MPLVPASSEVEVTLRNLVQQRVVVRGACVVQDIAVDAVQTLTED